AIHRALLAGLLSNIAMRQDDGQYTGGGGMPLFLWPGSVLAKKKRPWIIAAELVETSRRFLRTAGPIDPAWAEPLGEHLVKRTYSDPHWHRKRRAAMAFERVTLFGLPIVAR